MTVPAAATPTVAARAAPVPAARNPGILLGMLVLYVVWGSTYLGIAVAVQSIPPFLMAATRFVLAGVILLGLSRIRGGRDFEWPNRREWRDSLIVGGLLLGGGMGMVAFAEQTIPSGITAILIAMLPVWVAIFSRLFFGERLPRGAIIGIAIGFVGVAVLVGPTALGIEGGLEPLGLAAAILSPICWSIGSLFASHKAVLPRRPLVLAGAEMLAGGLILVAMSGASGELATFHIADVTSGVVHRAHVPDRRRQPDRVHDLRLAAAQGAALADRDLRLRQPRRRGRSWGSWSSRSRSRRARSSRARSSCSRSR